MKQLILVWVESSWKSVDPDSIKKSFESVYEKCYSPPFIEEALKNRENIYPVITIEQTIPDENMGYYY